MLAATRKNSGKNARNHASNHARNHARPNSFRGALFFWGVLFGLTFCPGGLAYVSASPRVDPALENWLQAEYTFSIQILEKHISPLGALPGVVIASPQKADHDYFRFWVRDAALVMDVYARWYERAAAAAERQRLLRRLMDYAELSRRQQLTPNPSGAADGSGLGEPLFEIDGRPFDRGWGRPQNDGPALRAITLIKFSRQLLLEGRCELVASLYDGRFPSQSVIKVDLEYVANHWREPCFDLWEEINGKHFYTRMVQRKALIEGAALADILGDGFAANWYRTQANALAMEIGRHWNSEGRFILATLDRVGGLDSKSSNLDTSVILALLHGDVGNGFFAARNDYALATVVRLMDAFTELYAINRELNTKQSLGPGMGRYPEDRYEGSGPNDGGNPWVLLTFGVAEYFYRVAADLKRTERVNIDALNFAFLSRVAPGLQLRLGDRIMSDEPRFQILLNGIKESGDSFLRRVQKHTAGSLHLSEQFNRRTGKMQSAQDLTWNYAAFVTVMAARNEIR